MSNKHVKNIYSSIVLKYFFYCTYCQRGIHYCNCRSLS